MHVYILNVSQSKFHNIFGLNILVPDIDEQCLLGNSRLPGIKVPRDHSFMYAKFSEKIIFLAL